MLRVLLPVLRDHTVSKILRSGKHLFDIIRRLRLRDPSQARDAIADSGQMDRERRSPITLKDIRDIGPLPLHHRKEVHEQLRAIWFPSSGSDQEEFPLGGEALLHGFALRQLISATA